jgi:hypothetical protein
LKVEGEDGVPCRYSCRGLRHRFDAPVPVPVHAHAHTQAPPSPPPLRAPSRAGQVGRDSDPSLPVNGTFVHPHGPL